MTLTWVTFKQFRDWFEIAYFVATVLMALAAWVALKHLKIAKATLEQAQRDLQVRSKREAVSLAIELCREYGTDFGKRYEAEMVDLHKNGFVFFRWPMSDLEFAHSSIVNRQEADQWVLQFTKNRALALRAVAILNELEAFALPFAGGVADEEVAYPVIGKLFIDAVLGFAPYLITLRDDKDRNIISGKFPNTVALFRLWYARSGRAELDEKQKQLAAEQNKLPKLEPIKPIGT
jgi:hypothetical protein